MLKTLRAVKYIPCNGKKRVSTDLQTAKYAPFAIHIYDMECIRHHKSVDGVRRALKEAL